ncbi:MAG: hypothetical protein HQ488_02360 [Parcubacteria group bacterium]|nr:hypothetical protein [Parcubacteria group bacterium]
MTDKNPRKRIKRSKAPKPWTKEITIVRGGHPMSERTLMVNRFGKPKTRIDPQLEYFLGTGVVLPRHCCMISFMAGLHQAGFTVYVNDYRNWKGGYQHPPKLTTFKPEGVYVPEYVLMGMLWATGKWDAHTAKTRQRGLSVGTLVDLGIWR